MSGRGNGERGTAGRIFFSFLYLLLVTCHLSLPQSFAGQWPSLFRGVIVADSQVGVRVISVEESSQAFQADLRPEDIIISVEGQAVRSIDEFAALSTSLKGRATLATVVVFRRGAPREIRVHLYSYSVLRTWGIEFIPEYDLRFAEPHIGLEFGRGWGAGSRKPASQAMRSTRISTVCTTCHPMPRPR